jgi:hypothetical protein
VKNARSLLLGVRAEMLQRVLFFRGKSGLLLFSHLLRSNLCQFVRPGFTDQYSNFVIGWLAAMLDGESLDCGVALRTPHTVLFEQFIRDTTNLESMIFAFGIAARLCRGCGKVGKRSLLSNFSIACFRLRASVGKCCLAMLPLLFELDRADVVER